MTIATERYLAVCQPFKHSNFTRGRIALIFCLIYVLAFPICSLAAFQVGSCGCCVFLRTFLIVRRISAFKDHLMRLMIPKLFTFGRDCNYQI